MLLLLMMIEGYTSSAVGFFLPSCLLIFCGCVFNTTLPPRNSYLTFVLFGTYLRLFRVIVRYMFVSFPPFCIGPEQCFRNRCRKNRLRCIQ